VEDELPKDEKWVIVFESEPNKHNPSLSYGTKLKLKKQQLCLNKD
jgi:hypothetical protein